VKKFEDRIFDKDLDIPIFRDISEDARKRILYPDHILVVKPHPRVLLESEETPQLNSL